jgi:hypothetical protein
MRMGSATVSGESSSTELEQDISLLKAVSGYHQKDNYEPHSPFTSASTMPFSASCASLHVTEVSDLDSERSSEVPAWNSHADLSDHILNDVHEAAYLLDPCSEGSPIVGVSAGACQLTGRGQDQFLKASVGREEFLKGVPQEALSKSVQKGIANYLSTCQLCGIEAMGEFACLQPCAREDGSHFSCMFLMGLCLLKSRSGRQQFVLCIQVPICEGLTARVSKSEKAHAIESARSIFLRTRRRLETADLDGCGNGGLQSAYTEWQQQQQQQRTATSKNVARDFAFVSGRLQDHCVLVNNGCTAIRREARDIAQQCLLFGNRPLQRRADGGLSFSVRIDDVTEKFIGLPILGFTRRRPVVEDKDLYPTVTRCMGSSVLIGACGEAFRRDQHEHLEMGFRKPPVEELRTWTSSSSSCKSQRLGNRSRVTELQAMDELQCVYTRDGHIVLRLNGESLLDFNIEKPIEDGIEYYPVIDVCLSATSLTILKDSSSSAEKQCPSAAL